MEEKDETVAEPVTETIADTVEAHEKRRQEVEADEDDILVQVLDIPEGDYQCVMVNSSWAERGLLEGDIILFAARDNPEEGDIVLLEENSATRLGISAEIGYLQTSRGKRQLEWNEHIIGVGVALARKLGPKKKSDESDAG